MSPTRAGGTTYLLLFLSFILYITLNYFTLRHEHTELLGQYGVLFLLFLLIYLQSPENSKVLFWAAITFRIVLLFSIPNLSDDFYRFIWDGRLVNAGINPFAEQPLFYLENPALAPANINQVLYQYLNSNNFTIYPPVLQGVFWLATYLFPTSIFGSMVVMKLFILAAETGSLFLLKNLLVAFNLPSRNMLLYSLNPLIILEFSGNIHFEAFMIFFLLLSIWLMQKKPHSSALSFALAVGSKLNPLIFLPLLFKRLGFRGNLLYSGIVGIVTLILFIPLLGKDLWHGLTDSILLYFQKFEFNASIYYLVREFGFWVKGYNVIQIVGKYLALSTFLLIMLFTVWEWKRKISTPVAFLLVYLIYMAFATIVHPWYITPLIAFCVLTPFRFPILWSFLIFFTYSGYSQNGFEENLWLMLVEYGLLFTYLVWEVRSVSKTKPALNV